MSETSQATLPAETAKPGTETAKTSPEATSSTTTSLLGTEAKPSNETTEKSVLGTEAEKKVELGKEGDKKPEPKAAEGPPEKYEFKAPEGYELDTKVIEEASALFKEAGLTQARATKLVDLYSRQMQQSSQASLQSVKDMRAGWVKEAKALPNIGNELGPQGKVVQQLGRALDTLVSTQAITAKLANDFKQTLDLTGAGDHPAVIKVIHALTSHFAEGTAVRGGGPSKFGQSQPGSERRSAADEIYPNLAAKG